MKMRIKEIRVKAGMKQNQLADAAGLSRPYMSTLETGNVKKSPSVETLTNIAGALGVRIGDLFADNRLISIAGKVGAGAKVPLIDAFEKGDGLYQVVSPSELPRDLDVVGVEVEGDSMIPTYRNGDVLFYTRGAVGVPTEAVGAICVCEDQSGDAWVKYVKSGSEPGKFHLISLNPLSDNMFDVTLKWAAPVRLAWPRDLVERV